MKRALQIIIAILIIGLIGVAVWWFFFIKTPVTSTPGDDTNNPGFSPFGNNNNHGTNPGNTKPGQGTSTSTTVSAPIPTLRLLSTTPVGGYGVTTTPTTTIVRWIDRGRGSIREAKEDSLDVNTLSNTLLPKIYQSQWSKNLDSFIGSTLYDGSGRLHTMYTEIKSQVVASSTDSNSANVSMYELKGQNLPDEVAAYAISPKKDRVFFFSVQNGHGLGYISAVTGGTLTQIFDTPVTEVNVEWPEENTIAITTKGSASQNGYLYFVNPKSGIWKRILGPIPGMSASVSHDAKYVIVSTPGSNETIQTAVFTVASSTGTNAIIQTLADKCTWGNFYKNLVYCAVPSSPVRGIYPDDWYMGTVSFSDKIWQINAITGEVHVVSDIIDQSDRLIDGFNLGIDAKDNYLIFMNKNDLSLWSLDLVRSK